MSTLQQFALYNLSPALVGGTLAWAAVGAGVHLLGVRNGKLRFCLFSAPLVKSTLLLLGAEAIHSPLIATDEPATIVFPAALIDRLSADGLLPRLGRRRH